MNCCLGFFTIFFSEGRNLGKEFLRCCSSCEFRSSCLSREIVLRRRKISSCSSFQLNSFFKLFLICSASGTGWLKRKTLLLGGRSLVWNSDSFLSTSKKGIPKGVSRVHYDCSCSSFSKFRGEYSSDSSSSGIVWFAPMEVPRRRLPSSLIWVSSWREKLEDCSQEIYFMDY